MSKFWTVRPRAEGNGLFLKVDGASIGFHSRSTALLIASMTRCGSRWRGQFGEETKKGSKIDVAGWCIDRASEFVRLSGEKII